MSARVCHGPFYLQKGATTGGGFFAMATEDGEDLVHLAIGQVVVGVMGSNDVKHYFLDRKQACDLIVALADALVLLENRKGNK